MIYCRSRATACSAHSRVSGNPDGLLLVMECSGSPLSRGRADVTRERQDAHGGRLSCLAQRRPPRLSRRRARQRRHHASGVPRRRALDRKALRHRRRSGAARAHDLPLAQDRRAGAARLANSEDARRFARAAPVLRDLGGGDLRADGPRARSCRRLLHRLCGDAEIFRQRRAAKIRRQPRRVLRIHARQPYLLLLRDRAAADRPHQARAPAERSDALCRRGQGARRRHRHQRRAAARHRRRRCPITST